MQHPEVIIAPSSTAVVHEKHHIEDEEDTPTVCCPRPAEGEDTFCYHACIATVVVHTVSFAFLGFSIWSIWLSFLFATTSGTCLLCRKKRDKGSYHSNAFFQVVAACFDMIAMVVWSIILAGGHINKYGAEDVLGGRGALCFSMVLVIFSWACACASAKGSCDAARELQMAPKQPMSLYLPSITQTINTITTTEQLFALDPNGQIIAAHPGQAVVMPDGRVFVQGAPGQPSRQLTQLEVQVYRDPMYHYSDAQSPYFMSESEKVV